MLTFYFKYDFIRIQLGPPPDSELLHFGTGIYILKGEPNMSTANIPTLKIAQYREVDENCNQSSNQPPKERIYSLIGKALKKSIDLHRQKLPSSKRIEEIQMIHRKMRDGIRAIEPPKIEEPLD